MVITQDQELIKKLKEVSNNTKNDLDRKTIKHIISQIQNNEQIEPESFVVFLEATGITKAILCILKKTKITQSIIDLIYFCVVNGMYTADDVLLILNCLSKADWEYSAKVKTLQMFFYFNAMKLNYEAYFIMLSIVIDNFVSLNIELDAIARPIVCNILDTILLLYKADDNSTAKDTAHKELFLEDTDPTLIFKFIQNIFIEKKQYFASYVLLHVVSYKEVGKIKEFKGFLIDSFASICLELLRKGTNNDRSVVYESIIIVKTKFNGSYLNMIYKSLDEVVTEASDNVLLLSFISDFIAIPDKNLSFDVNQTLIKILKNFNFSTLIIDKTLQIFKNIVQCIMLYMKLTYFVELLIEKITSSTHERYNELFLCCLEYCEKYDLREIFEKGLTLGYKGKINRSSSIACSMHRYMGYSWRIYFENTDVYSFKFLQEFELQHLSQFIDALPENLDLGEEVFMNCYEKLKYEDDDYEDAQEKIRLVEKLFKITENTKILIDLIIKFYILNSSVPALQSPMSILIAKFSVQYKYSGKALMDGNVIHYIEIPELIEASAGDLQTQISSNESLNLELSNGGFSLTENDSTNVYFFINEVLRTINPSNCWNQIFFLIYAGQNCEEQKSQVLLQIEQDFLNELDLFHIESFFFVLKNLFNSLPNYQALLNAVFIFGEFTDFVSKNCDDNDLWKKSIFFGLELTSSKDQYINSPDVIQAIIKHLFRTYRGIFNKFNNQDLDLYENILFQLTEAQHDQKTLVVILEEWEHCLKTIKVSKNTKRLLSFLTDKVIDNDDEISLKSFQVIEVLSKLLNFETTEDQSLNNGFPFSVDNNLKNDAQISCAGNKKTKNFLSKASLQTVNKVDFEKIANVAVNEINSTHLPVLMETQQEKEGVDEINELKQQIKDSFIKILGACDSKRYNVLSLVFLEIPTYVYNIDEIEKLSKELLRFVSMNETYRNSATDCFIRTCSTSEQFTFCLQMLSSWLSTEKVDISLSLISKISESLRMGTDTFEKNINMVGLSNFLDYSIQFCSSSVFLVPVLDLICKCECTFDYEMSKKLLVFSKVFLLKQLNVKYTDKRENVMLKYLQFLSKLMVIAKDVTNADQSYSLRINTALYSLFYEIISEIIRTKNLYFTLKLACYHQMFKFIEFYRPSLETIICKVFTNYIHSYLRCGVGMSKFNTEEVLYILKRIIIGENIDLINGVKADMINLLVISDYQIINSIRIILKKSFDYEHKQILNVYPVQNK